MNSIVRPLVLALGMLGGLAGTAQAQVEWKFNNGYAATRAESAHIRAFAESVNQKAAGKLKITVLEGGAMGLKDADALRWMQGGTPELGFTWPPFIARDSAEMASMYVFGVVSTPAEHQKALPTLQEIMRTELQKHSVEVIGFMGLAFLDGSIFCRQPIRSLAELRTMKLRVGTRDQIDTFKALGVAAQTVPQAELYSALQTGVVDCALYPATIAATVSLQEVAKHAVYTGFPFPPVPYALMANQAKWKALPDDLKAVVNGAAAEVAKNSFDNSKDIAAWDAARDKLRAQGVTFYGELPKADQDALRAAAMKSWEAVAAGGGPGAVQVRSRVARALGY